MQFSVKVMKSYNYCHFEAVLADEIDTPDGPDSIAAICDELGILAQQACDRQIARYKRQKAHCEDANPFEDYSTNRVFELIDKVPKGERTPEMKAAFKAKADYLHWRSREFNYEDECDFRGPGDYGVVREQLEAQV